MKINLRCSVFVILVIGCSACATSGLNVTSAYDEEASFDGIRKYRWLGGTMERLYKSAVSSEAIDTQIRRSIERELAKAGVEYAKQDETPDVYVAYHAVARQRRLDEFAPYGFEDKTKVTVPKVFDEGMLLIDLIDARELKLVWRGVGYSDLKKFDSNDDKRALAHANVAVKEILAQFPPN